MTKRYTITAWGSDEYPDILREEFDEIPADLNWKYQYVSIALDIPITKEMLDRSLETK